MKNLKQKFISLAACLIIAVCGLVCFGVSNFHENETNIPENAGVDSNIPVVDKAKALPQNADEIYCSTPSKETIENLPAYINKTIELMDSKSKDNDQSVTVNNTKNNKTIELMDSETKDNNQSVTVNNNKNELNFPHLGDGEIEQIYAVLTPNSKIWNL